jgi:2-polyprenyl-3-methyl-5-hydroxy-6-metoxy-1,4-benzoquinol methylase
MPDRFFFPDEYFKVVQCNHCGLGYVNPRPSFNEMQKYYPWDEEVFRCRKRPQKRYAAQAKYLREIEQRDGLKRLLDIGCAEGDFPRFMMARGWNVEAVETSTLAPRIRDFKVYSQAFDEIPVMGPSYDAITAWDVMEHVHDPMAYFRKAATVLKPGGLFVFNVPNLNSLASRFLFSQDVPRELYFFTEETVRRYLASAGLRPLKAEYNDKLLHMVPVNWLRYVIKTKIKGEPFYFRDRHLTRIEWRNRNRLKPGFFSDVRYAVSVPDALVEQMLMPLITRVQIMRGTFSVCTYVAAKL